MGELNKLKICDLSLLFLIIGVLLSNYFWLRMDGFPVVGHDLTGLIPAIQVYRDLKGMGNAYKTYDHILGIYNFNLVQPPLSFLIVVLFYLLFGPQGDMVAMVNSIYIIVTLVSIYLIGKNMFNRRIGLLSAFILSSFPGFAFSHIYWIEYSLMAYVCLDIYLLLKTNLFENRKYSILLGISLALSFLHKYSFILFILGPLLFVIYKSNVLWQILKMKWTKAAINFILALVLSLGLSSFWWAMYSKILLSHMLYSARSKGGETFISMPKILSFESLIYYFKSINFLIGGLSLVFFLFSIIYMLTKVILKNEKKFYISFLILWFIVTYIISTFIGIKYFVHILSILPSIAILVSAGIYFLKKGIYKTVLISLIILNGLNLHLSPFYSIGLFPNDYLIKGLRSIFSHPFIRAYNQPPRQEKLESIIKEIIKYIEADSQGEENVRALSVFERPAFKNCIFEYYSLIGDYKIRFFSSYKIISDLAETDYIIIEQPGGESVAEALSREYDVPDIERINFKKIFKEGLRGFDLIKVYKIPYGNTSALIYKRRFGEF